MNEEMTEITIIVSPKIYPLEVIYRVCYQFTDHYYLWLEPQDNGDVCVRISPKSGSMTPGQMRGEFGNALIDYAIRWSVARETQKVREILVSAALAETHRDS